MKDLLLEIVGTASLFIGGYLWTILAIGLLG